MGNPNPNPAFRRGSAGGSAVGSKHNVGLGISVHGKGYTCGVRFRVQLKARARARARLRIQDQGWTCGSSTCRPVGKVYMIKGIVCHGTRKGDLCTLKVLDLGRTRVGVVSVRGGVRVRVE